MAKRVHYHPNLIFSVGTQVVTLKDVVGQNGRTLHPRGAVGVVVKSPTDLDHAYRIRFPDGLEIDLVTHDAKKFFGLMLKKNGYVMEQVLSPLIVHTSPEHGELKAIAADCLTKHHAHHYLGFAATQWKLFQKEDPPRVKPLLYVYRVLLTGIHLMRTGEIEANVGRLNETFRLSYLPELIDRKISGTEKGTLDQADLAFHEQEYERLRTELEEAFEQSNLPEQPGGVAALNDLLVRVRLRRQGGA